MKTSDTDELARLHELQNYEILDTPPEVAFDRLVNLAASICKTPMATITFVDERRQWFKSTVGLDIRETDRSIAFCAQAINQRDIFLVYDAKVHPLFRTYPQVLPESGLRFYAGMPLVSPDGFAIGTLAVLDVVPRSLTKEQTEALQILASEVMAQLELRRQRNLLENMAAERDRINLALHHQAEHLKEAQRIAQVGSWELKIHENRLTWSEEVYRIFGVEPGEFDENFEDFFGFLHPDDSKSFLAERERVLHGEGSMNIEHRIILRDGQVKHVLELGELIKGEDGEPYILAGTVQDITERRRLETFKREQGAILMRIATGAGLKEVMHAAVRLVEEQYPATLCSILILDEEGRGLHAGASEKLPAEYMHALEGVHIGPKVGSCGTAAYTRQNVIVSDIASDPLWADYRELALSYGLRACWSIPIFSSKQQVLGTFAVYSLMSHIPTAEELELVGSCSHTVGIAIERHRSQMTLKLLETSVSRLNDMVVITEAEPVDLPGPRILFVNDAFVRRTGYSREEVIGKTPRILQGDKTQRSELDRIRAALEKWEPVRAELINYTKSGEEFWLELDIVPVADETGWYTHWVSIEREITKRKQADEEIKQLAFHDQLTKLPNRRLLLDRLKLAQASNARSHHQGALLFIDLDNFKILNDTQGHDKGDQLLQQVAERLITCVREDNTVSRLGGDEFVVMLTDLSQNLQEAANEAKIVGERILASFAEPYHVGDYEHHCTPSIGVALFGDAREPVEELLKRADLAMYQAKSAGRNTMRFFDPQMQTVISTRVAMEENLRQALRRNEFFLCYQPQVEGDNLITGAEALIRWQHPVRGLVSPAEFIPLAEDTGLILPLGQWVLETACAQLAKWAAKPDTEKLSLAVNVSLHQYRQPDFVKLVMQALERSGANPYRLKLELTESLLADDLEDIIAKMAALKARGVGFALDDFGTGYSSLSYLKRLPLDQLKIDQSFVRDVLTDPNDAAIARTIVALGQTLGLAVIAEGVETEEQRQFLASHGCHAYQGYLFSKPLPVDEFEAFLHVKAT